MECLAWAPLVALKATLLCWSSASHRSNSAFPHLQLTTFKVVLEIASSLSVRYKLAHSVTPCFWTLTRQCKSHSRLIRVSTLAATSTSGTSARCSISASMRGETHRSGECIRCLLLSLTSAMALLTSSFFAKSDKAKGCLSFKRYATSGWSLYKLNEVDVRVRCNMFRMYRIEKGVTGRKERSNK